MPAAPPRASGNGGGCHLLHRGKRTERVVRAPVQDFSGHILLTPEDEQDLKNVQPFVLTTERSRNTSSAYLGQAECDEIPCYALRSSPEDGEGAAVLPGRDLVDDPRHADRQDSARVASWEGQRVPEVRDPTASRSTAKYWFPTYTRADDTLTSNRAPSGSGCW